MTRGLDSAEEYHVEVTIRASLEDKRAQDTHEDGEEDGGHSDHHVLVLVEDVEKLESV